MGEIEMDYDPVRILLIKRLYMSILKAGRCAELVLQNEEVSPMEEENLRNIIKLAERGMEYLRDMSIVGGGWAMPRTLDSSPFIKGQYMQKVKSAESAANILKTEKNLPSKERRRLEEIVEQGEIAKEHLREMGVKRVE
jgi:hypothetical protein